MNFEGKIALVTGASRGIEFSRNLLKLSRPVARKLLALRPVKMALRRSVII